MTRNNSARLLNGHYHAAQVIALRTDKHIFGSFPLCHNANFLDAQCLKGIQLKPEGQSELLDFFFDSEGNLRSPMNIVLIRDGMLKPEDAWISVKTQFLSADTHVWIIGLLKYVKSRYLSNLKVSDEAEYWETGNRQILEEKMRLINEKLDYISCELSSEHFGDTTGLSADEIASRIERLFHTDEQKEAEQSGGE